MQLHVMQAGFECHDRQCGGPTGKAHPLPYSVCASPVPSAGGGLGRGPHRHDADNQICTASYIELYRLDGNKTHIASIAATLDEEIAMTAANATAVADYWDWADALFMGMNPYARLGNVTGEAKYHDQVDRYCWFG